MKYKQPLSLLTLLKVDRADNYDVSSPVGD